MTSQTITAKRVGILRSTSVVAFMTLISRVLGFVRDILFAILFGAGPAFDAFVVAFKLPNFFRRLFAEGAFSQAFVPVLASYQTTHSPREVKNFLDHIAGSLALALFILVVVTEIFAPVFVMIFAPGFLHDPTRYDAAVHMVHIIFPYLFLISMTAFAGAILNCYHRFALSAFAPSLLNLVLIAVAWWWAPYTASPIYTLAWGVLLGGIVQLLAQYPVLSTIDAMPIPRLSWHDEGVRRVLKLMVPALFGVSVAQLSLLIDNFFASYLPAGSISWLYYSDRLIYFPQGIIGVALATVVLPSLSRHHAVQDGENYSRTLDWALRSCLFVGVPAALGLVFLAGPILSTLIHHGKFGDHDVMMTARSLQAFAFGLPAFMLIKILASGFYSQHNIKTPVKVAAFALVFNIVGNLLLIQPLAHAGLALSTSIASSVNAFALFYLLKRQGRYRPDHRWRGFFTRLIISNVFLGLGLLFLAGPLSEWLSWSLWIKIWHLLFIILAALSLYVALWWVMGSRRADWQV
jgi:putative peptidoglycan lipid II flippase